MKWALYEPLPEKIEYGGRTYRLDLSCKTVLRYMHLCDNPEGLTAEEVAEIGFDWLVKSGKKLVLHDKTEILSAIITRYISPPRRKLNNEQPLSVVDFDYDSGYIYASFMQTYGVDLYACAGALHWCKFIALFEGLPDDSVIKQIMRVRARPIPVPTKHNREEIQQLTELKALYALPLKAADEKTVNDGWNKLFDTLERQAR